MSVSIFPLVLWAWLLWTDIETVTFILKIPTWFCSSLWAFTNIYNPAEFKRCYTMSIRSLAPAKLLLFWSIQQWNKLTKQYITGVSITYFNSFVEGKIPFDDAKLFSGHLHHVVKETLHYEKKRLTGNLIISVQIELRVWMKFTL